jgi:hypothetical protein
MLDLSLAWGVGNAILVAIMWTYAKESKTMPTFGIRILLLGTSAALA